MKGRRKPKTAKWRVKFEIEAAAKKRLLARTDKQGRLLDIASQQGDNLEPIGRLAG